MTLRVTRLALPFTDADFATADVVISNPSIPAQFTVTVPLPSVDGVSGGYYNGGDLGTADTSTFTLPNESLAMALAMEIAAHVAGFPITVAEDVLPGRYVFTKKDLTAWSILWDDAATTMPGHWLGFDQVTYASAAGVITAPWQSGRLWIGTRPTWHRVREHKKTSHALTWSGGESSRQLSSIRLEHELKFSAQVGPKVYRYDGTIACLVVMVANMAVGDPNVALEALWEWIAARAPVQYWADEDDLTTSEYLRPLNNEMLEGVIRNVNAERSNAPPVYDLVMPFVTSSAGAVGEGGGGKICPVAEAIPEVATYDDLPASATDGSIYKVTTTAAAGAYSFAGDIDGIIAGVWVPLSWAIRGMTWVQDGAGNPSRYDGVAGENKASQQSRGWIDASAGGVVSDGTDTIKLTAAFSGQYAYFHFTPAAMPLGNYAVLLEFDQVLTTTVDNNNEGMFIVDDAFKRHFMGTVADNTKNRMAFIRDNSTVENGAGYFDVASFGRVIGELELGSAGLAPNPGLSRLWISNDGWDPVGVSCCSAENRDLASVGARSIAFWTQHKGGAGSTELQVKRFYLLRLGTP